MSGAEEIVVRDPRYDTTFKILFGESGAELRTKHFLNTLLDLKGDNEIKELTFLNTSHSSIENRTMHFDIGLECSCVTNARTRFVVEMQKARVVGHTNRWVVYGAKELMSVGSTIFANSENLTGEERKKVKSQYYRDHVPVKVIAILDFDPASLEGELQNKDNIVVHWDISERESQEISTELLSWTFVVLPRFLKTLQGSSEVEVQDALSAWLYLLTRDDMEKLRLSDKITFGITEVESGYKRLSQLTHNETDSVFRDRDSYIAAVNAQLLAKEEGRIEGKIEVKIEIIKNMLRQGLPVELCAECAGMSLQDVQKIRLQGLAEQELQRSSPASSGQTGDGPAGAIGR
jgi:hypothetical protein